jgi:hypothetical protein
MRKASIVGFLSLIFIFSCSVMAQDDEERDVLEITLAGGLAIPGGGITDLDNPKFTTFVLNVTQNRYRAISYDPALAFGFGLGVFYFTSDYSGLFLEANYHEVLASSIEAEYNNVIYEFNEDFSTVNINFGIRILIGSGD